jgi:hypothetical protein
MTIVRVFFVLLLHVLKRLLLPQTSFEVLPDCYPFPSLVLPSGSSEEKKRKKKEIFGLQARNLGVQSPSFLVHVWVVCKRQ